MAIIKTCHSVSMMVNSFLQYPSSWGEKCVSLVAVIYCQNTAWLVTIVHGRIDRLHQVLCYRIKALHNNRTCRPGAANTPNNRQFARNVTEFSALLKKLDLQYIVYVLCLKSPLGLFSGRGWTCTRVAFQLSPKTVIKKSQDDSY